MSAIEDERSKWVAAHSLRINENRRNHQIPQLEHFGSPLHLCCCRYSEKGLDYLHYFVTDLIWTLEFDSTGVAVHCKPLPLPYHVEATFEKSRPVIDRMSKICGATGYSVTWLCLSLELFSEQSLVLSAVMTFYLIILRLTCLTCFSAIFR